MCTMTFSFSPRLRSMFGCMRSFQKFTKPRGFQLTSWLSHLTEEFDCYTEKS